jgi:hypothetical protein
MSRDGEAVVRLVTFRVFVALTSRVACVLSWVEILHQRTLQQ